MSAHVEFINPRLLYEVLAELVQIDSTNPSLSPAGAGEKQIVAALEKIFTGIGIASTIHESTPGRPSIVARLPGNGAGPSLLLNAHVDTVGVEGMTAPFSGQIDRKSGRCYGRGAFDMKGSMAAQIAAVEALLRSGQPLGGDVLIAGVADEEFASLGVQEIIPHYPIDAAIVTEPTNLQISIAHKGFIWVEVRTFGKAYHGSRPDLGVDANMMMGRVLAELDKLEQELAGRSPHPLLGPPSLHAAMICGGTEWSAYAAECVLSIERRTLPGETAAQVEKEIEALLIRLRAQDPLFKGSLMVKLIRQPFEADPNSTIVRALKRAAGRVLPQTPPFIGQKFWTDAAFHAAGGVDTVLIGPAGHGMHAAEEWVDLDSLIKLAHILALTARDFCGVAG